MEEGSVSVKLSETANIPISNGAASAVATNGSAETSALRSDPEQNGSSSSDSGGGVAAKVTPTLTFPL